jgi:hypothetical protein
MFPFNIKKGLDHFVCHRAGRIYNRMTSVRKDKGSHLFNPEYALEISLN